LIDYYLKHEQEREEIAQAGYEVVLAEHSFDHRVETLLSTIF